MTDRELLEAAAKAAGERIFVERQKERDEMGYGHVGLWLARGHTMWNPLTIDGDALRLAVKLRIIFDIMPARGCYMVTAEAFGGPNVEAWSVGWEDCDQAARRAIVLAAASMASSDAKGQ